MARGGLDSGNHDKASAGRSASPGKPGVNARRGSATQGELLPDGKLYYRIGEVAKITGVKPHVLRYWETEFRWMSPPKSRSRQRLYRRKDIEMITVIKRLLYEERYTIAGARQRLRELGLAKAREGAGQETESASCSVAPGEIAASDRASTPFARLRDELEQIRAVLAEPLA